MLKTVEFATLAATLVAAPATLAAAQCTGESVGSWTGTEATGTVGREACFPTGPASTVSGGVSAPSGNSLGLQGNNISQPYANPPSTNSIGTGSIGTAGGTIHMPTGPGSTVSGGIAALGGNSLGPGVTGAAGSTVHIPTGPSSTAAGGISAPGGNSLGLQSGNMTQPLANPPLTNSSALPSNLSGANNPIASNPAGSSSLNGSVSGTSTAAPGSTGTSGSTSR